MTPQQTAQGTKTKSPDQGTKIIYPPKNAKKKDEKNKNHTLGHYIQLINLNLKLIRALCFA